MFVIFEASVLNMDHVIRVDIVNGNKVQAEYLTALQPKIQGNQSVTGVVLKVQTLYTGSEGECERFIGALGDALNSEVTAISIETIKDGM